MLSRHEIENVNHLRVKTVTAAYTVGPKDDVILVDATGGAVTVTLPDAVAFKSLAVVIKKIDSSGNAVTIATSPSAQTIDGAATQSISAQWDIFKVVSDGTNWQSLSIPTAVASGALLLTGGTLTGALIINKAAAGALVVGPNGSTNPTLNVDTSTASAATGLNIASRAAGSGVIITVLSSGANEGFAFSSKGTGPMRFTPGTDNATAFQVTRADGVTNLIKVDTSTPLIAISAQINTSAGFTLTAAANNIFAIGANGLTNPVFNIDTSVASVATGLNIQGKAAGGGVVLSVISSGANEDLFIKTKGTGGVKIVPGSDNASAFTVYKADGTTQLLKVNSSSGEILLGSAGNITSNGTMTFQSYLDSASAFLFKNNSLGNTILSLDSSNIRVGIGKASPSVTLDVNGATSIAGTLTLTGTGNGITVNSATLITTTTALTNNAAAQVATITNGPTAGNPTKWIPINDNGTTRNIPAW